MSTYRTPGVYIQEIPAVGPIAGVGTSTAAFLGPTAEGPFNEPTKITSWTQYKKTFGEGWEISNLYMPHAVRGFFDNGGTVAYIVRVGSGTTAFLALEDRSKQNDSISLKVKAKKSGTVGNTIEIHVQQDSIQSTKAAKAQVDVVAVQKNIVTLNNQNDAGKFRVGDVVTIEDDKPSELKTLAIERIRDKDLILQGELTGKPATVRIANLRVGQHTLRVENSQGIEPGTIIHLQQDTIEEYCVVSGVSGNFVTLSGDGLTKEYPMAAEAKPVNINSVEFSLAVTQPEPESLPRLSMDPRHSRYFARIVNPASKLINVVWPDTPTTQPPPNNLPKVISVQALQGGSDGKQPGHEDYRNALEALAKIDDVSLVCVPGCMDEAVRTSVREHCETMKDRFAIFDSKLGDKHDDVSAGLTSITSKGGYAALYYPWIKIIHPGSRSGDDTLLIPPSGHIAGIYARSDSQRGVHKAPANEFINGALDLERNLTDTEQGELNDKGINALRLFPNLPPIVWGARTTAPEDQTAWRYINVRRLMLFIEESLQEGLRWAVFEPNDRSLWKKLERTTTAFLTRVWQSGALFGRTSEEAFSVKIDDELNPPDVRALGQVVMEIGVAPVRPAEFIVVRIALREGSAALQES